MVSTATEAVTLEPDAFARMVTEEGLKIVDVGNARYAGKRGKSGWELYKTGNARAYLYQARRVAQQTNAAGGAIIIDMSVSTGMMAQLMTLYAKNSGTNTLTSALYDEDNAWHAVMSYVASAAANETILPSIGTAATATGNKIDAKSLLCGPGTKLSVYQSAAGLQNDTLTVGVQLLLPITAKSDGSDISWSTARSTNPADVTLAASTISAANTMQVVYLP